MGLIINESTRNISWFVAYLWAQSFSEQIAFTNFNIFLKTNTSFYVLLFVDFYDVYRIFFFELIIKFLLYWNYKASP